MMRIYRFIGAFALSCASWPAAYAAPIFGRGGSMQSSAISPNWKVTEDGIAHFASIDGSTQIAGVAASILAQNATNASAAVSSEVQRAMSVEAQLAPLASPVFTGTPIAPTAQAGAANGLVATTGYADRAVSAEVQRAVSIENQTTAALTAETTRAQGVETSLLPKSALGQPGGVAGLDAEGTLGNTPLVSGLTGAQAAQQIQTAAAQTAAEATRAQGAETALNTSLAAVKAGAVSVSQRNAANGVAGLDGLSRVTSQVVGDVSQAPANAAGESVSVVSGIAHAAIPGAARNAANGVAGLDSAGHVTSQVVGDVSQAPADATGDTVGTIAGVARAAVPNAAIGAVNGVAGLDATGHVTAPVQSQSVSASSILRLGTFAGTHSSQGLQFASPIMSFGTASSDAGDPYDLPGLAGLPTDRALIIGGQHADAKGYLWVSGQPDSDNLGAVVDFVAMNGMSLGQGTGVTAGGFGTMANYMNYDAAARGTRTGSTPPRFVVSSAIKDPDGISHTVTFSGTGATFTPALPAYWGKLIHAGMNVATNEVGVQSIPQNGWEFPWLHNVFRRTFNTYFGTITGWTKNIDGTITGITVDGWVIPMQAGTYGAAVGRVPGVDTLDGSLPHIDTQFTNIGAPALLFGIFTKAFLGYDLCDLEPDSVSNPDINNPLGSKNSLIHECDYERDLWNHDPRDYVNSLHGMTYAFNNDGGGKLTWDSYGTMIDGGHALPQGYISNNILPGAAAFTAIGDRSVIRNNIYAPYDVGRNVGDTSVQQSWQSEMASGGVNTSTLRLIEYRDTADADPSKVSNAVAQSEVSMHLQWRMDTTPDPQAEQGAIGAQIVYNPSGYLYGLGIGAGGTFQNPLYAITVDKNGNLWLPQGGNVTGGQGMGFIPASGDDAGHPYIAGHDSSTLDFKTSAGSYAAANLYGLTTMGGSINITAGQGLGLIHTTGDNAGHAYFAATDNYHLILNDTAGGQAGLQLGDLTVNGAATITRALTLSGGGNVTGGQGMGFIPASGDSSGHAFITGSSPSTLDFLTSSGGYAAINVYGLTTKSLSYMAGVSTPYVITDGIGAKASGGMVTVTSPLRVYGTSTDGSYALQQLPTGQSDGAHAWCSDCKLNGATGVEAYWHNSAGKWLDSQNNGLSN